MSVKWLSIPVKVKGKYYQKIRETEIAGSDWQSSHWNFLLQKYSHAPYFNDIALWLEPLYFKETYTNLSSTNFKFILTIYQLIQKSPVLGIMII